MCTKHFKTVVSILTVSLCAATSGYSQLQKGVAQFGFDLNFSSPKTEYIEYDGLYRREASNKTFTVVPMAGWFVSEKFLVGAKLGWSKTKLENNADAYTYAGLSKTLYYGPYARYYKMFGGKAGFFLEASALFGDGDNDYSNHNENTGLTESGHSATKSFAATIRPGIVYFVGKRFALESTIGALSYQRRKYELEDDTWYNSNIQKTFGISVSPATINFGLTYYLVRGSE